MLILIPFIIILFLNIFTVALSNERFGKCLPITQFLVVFSLYLSQLLTSSFIMGYIIIISFAFISIFSALSKWNNIKTNILSGGLIMFITIVVFFGIIDYGRTFSDIDEFWHWGMMVKEMLRLDSFYCATNSHMIIHKDYPPFPALYEMFWCALSGGYSESVSTFALHLLSFSFLLCPFVENLPIFNLSSSAANNNNNLYRKTAHLFNVTIIALLTLFLFGIIIALCDGSRSFNKILTDVPLAIFFSCGLYNIALGGTTKTRFDYISLTATLIMLTMTKQIGLELSLVVILLYTLELFLCNSDTRINRRNLTKSLLLIIIPYSFKFSWDSLVKYLHVTDIRSLGDGVGQFDSNKFNVTEYIQAITGSNDNLMTQTMENLKIAFFTKNIFSLPNISISFVLAVILILISIIGFLFYKNSIFKTNLIISLLITTVLGTLGFMLLLTIAFCFGFTTDEMEELRGYTRYVDSYVIGLVIMIVQAYITQFFSYDTRIKSLKLQPVKKILLAVLVLLTFYFSTERYDFVPQINYKRANQWSFSEKNITPNVHENSNVGIILDDKRKTAQWIDECMFQYYINKSSVTVLEFDNIDLSNNETSYKIIELAKQSDYIYTADDSNSIYDYVNSHIDNPPVVLTN